MYLYWNVPTGKEWGSVTVDPILGQGAVKGTFCELGILYHLWSLIWTRYVARDTQNSILKISESEEQNFSAFIHQLRQLIPAGPYWVWRPAERAVLDFPPGGKKHTIFFLLFLLSFYFFLLSFLLSFFLYHSIFFFFFSFLYINISFYLYFFLSLCLSLAENRKSQVPYRYKPCKIVIPTPGLGLEWKIPTRGQL